MRIDEVERDLKVIRQAMEASSRYTNITARGYFFTGVVALLGVWQTYTLLGHAKLTNLTLITLADRQGLLLIWGTVFVAALGIVAFFSWRKARRNQISAWNSLAARMFYSQIPLVGIAGILTLALGRQGYYAVIPGVWLALYGVILYSFSYFTGRGHKIEGSLFMLLGCVALFAPGPFTLFLLGAGFGGIHVVSSFVRWGLRGTRRHESK